MLIENCRALERIAVGQSAAQSTRSKKRFEVLRGPQSENDEASKPLGLETHNGDYCSRGGSGCARPWSDGELNRTAPRAPPRFGAGRCRTVVNFQPALTKAGDQDDGKNQNFLVHQLPSAHVGPEALAAASPPTAGLFYSLVAGQPMN